MTTRCHTFSGCGFDPFKPRPEDVRLEDIAHQLAMLCRFGGACPVFYSVAEHAVRVARIVETWTGKPSWALAALHHDSAEAYIGDVRRPIKACVLVATEDGRFVSFESFERSVQVAIAEALWLAKSMTLADMVGIRNEINRADDLMLALEFAAFFGKPMPGGSHQEKFLPEQPWSWRAAENAFLLEHRRLAEAARPDRRAE